MTVQVRLLGSVGEDSSPFKAAADFMGPGAIETPKFETEIFDIIRRSSIPLRRIKQKPATGHPHRYFEQTAIATGSAVDPRNLSATATGPTRVERMAYIKAMIAQTNISLFDKDVTEQQGQFAGVVAKDIDDIISGIEVLRGNMLWTGTDTSLIVPTTLQWVGGLTQITQQFTVGSGSSIIDGIKTAIATMVSNPQFIPKPTGIILNPLLINYIEQEAKAAHIELGTENVVAGVSVKSISTQVGNLPLIPDQYMPFGTGAQFGYGAPPGGFNNYYLAILSEPEIEIPVISGRDHNPNPRLFQLGLVGNLAGQFVAVKFDTIIFKGPSYAHATMAVVRV